MYFRKLAEVRDAVDRYIALQVELDLSASCLVQWHLIT